MKSEMPFDPFRQTAVGTRHLGQHEMHDILAHILVAA